MRTIIGGISSRGMKAGFSTCLVEIEHGQHEMQTQLKSKTGFLHPEKYAGHFMESPRVLCYYNVSTESFI
jgi:hypothetical protein